MTKRRKWEADEIRTMFSLRAQGKEIKAIAKIMGTSTCTVGRILRRQIHTNVDVDGPVLRAVADRYRKPPAIDGSSGKAGVVPQAMKSADPAYKSASKSGNLIDSAALANEKDTREPAATHEEMNLVPPKPVLTKAQALQSVLGHVSDANHARAAVKEALLVVEMLRQDAKRLEDAAFTFITELEELGFTPKFLNAFLDECGLCTDGLSTEA